MTEETFSVEEGELEEIVIRYCCDVSWQGGNIAECSVCARELCTLHKAAGEDKCVYCMLGARPPPSRTRRFYQEV